MRPLIVGFASLAAVVFVNCLATPVMADWDPGDGYKMRAPQLPDPEGWDIRINNARRQPGEPFQWVCADDWLCTATGPVTDVHLWVSWMEDRSDKIVNLHLSIHDDVPAGADLDPDVTWSHPGAIRWERDFGPDEFTIRDYGTGDQGWYDPPFDEWQRPDHQGFQQINVVNIPRPFTQEEGTIYWLDVSVDLWGESELAKLGWKTSLDHFGDDAVYWNYGETAVVGAPRPDNSREVARPGLRDHSGTLDPRPLGRGYPCPAGLRLAKSPPTLSFDRTDVLQGRRDQKRGGSDGCHGWLVQPRYRHCWASQQ